MARIFFRGKPFQGKFNQLHNHWRMKLAGCRNRTSVPIGCCVLTGPQAEKGPELYNQRLLPSAKRLDGFNLGLPPGHSAAQQTEREKKKIKVDSFTTLAFTQSESICHFLHLSRCAGSRITGHLTQLSYNHINFRDEEIFILKSSAWKVWTKICGGSYHKSPRWDSHQI